MTRRSRHPAKVGRRTDVPRKIAARVAKNRGLAVLEI